MLETAHSVDTATLGGLGGIPLYVFSMADCFKEFSIFLLRFEPCIIKNIIYNFFLIVGMLEMVLSVDTATLGGLGGIPLYVISSVNGFKEFSILLLRFQPCIIKNILYNFFLIVGMLETAHS